jgi:hypothetical protein
MFTHLSTVVHQMARHVHWFALHLRVDVCSSERKRSSRSPAGEQLRKWYLVVHVLYIL